MKRNYALRRAIVDGYAAGRSPAAIALEHGSTAASVIVMAVRLGVSRRPAAAAIQRRGFVVPPELAADYRLLMRVGRYSAREAARQLGLLP